MKEPQTIQNAYLAYYGRPADPGGLDYWAERLKEAGGNLGEIIAAFGTSAEFTDRFGELGTTELVNAIYQRLFKRDADPDGLKFYRDLLESGQKHLGSIALDIFNGVKREGDRQSPPLDWEIIEELQRTANAFTEQVRLGDLDYSGERGLEIGTQIIASIPSHEPEIVRVRESAILGEEQTDLYDFNLLYIRPDWYAGMFTSQLGDDRSMITIDRIGDVGGSIFGIANSRWTKIHTLWPKNDDHITFVGRFHDFDWRNRSSQNTDEDGYYLYNMPPGDYLIELTGNELPDNATIINIWGHNAFSDAYNNLETGFLEFSDPILEYAFRIEEPLSFLIQVSGQNNDYKYELTVTRQENANHPVYTPDWIPYDNSERIEFLDFIFVEPPPEFYDYII